MSARNAYLASITTAATAASHFGARFNIVTCVPFFTGRSVTSHTVTTAAGRTYIVRVGETLPASAL
jgi:hypothetical protein